MRGILVVEQLELSAHIGITEDERATPQRIAVTLRLEPEHDFTALEDRIENAVDYFKVCLAVKETVAQRPRNLIETLAEEIARDLLKKFALNAVEVELRKFILPGTAFVAVKIRREI